MIEILAALRALPEILKLLNNIGKWLQERFGDNPEKFIVDAAQAFEALNNAQTPAEKRDAARAIGALIRRL